MAIVIFLKLGPANAVEGRHDSLLQVVHGDEVTLGLATHQVDGNPLSLERPLEFLFAFYLVFILDLFDVALEFLGRKFLHFIKKLLGLGILAESGSAILHLQFAIHQSVESQLATICSWRTISTAPLDDGQANFLFQNGLAIHCRHHHAALMQLPEAQRFGCSQCGTGIQLGIFGLLFWPGGGNTQTGRGRRQGERGGNGTCRPDLPGQIGFLPAEPTGLFVGHHRCCLLLLLRSSARHSTGTGKLIRLTEPGNLLTHFRIVPSPGQTACPAGRRGGGLATSQKDGKTNQQACLATRRQSDDSSPPFVEIPAHGLHPPLHPHLVGVRPGRSGEASQ